MTNGFMSSIQLIFVGGESSQRSPVGRPNDERIQSGRKEAYGGNMGHVRIDNNG